MANIADFKAQMIGGGARPNQFRVELTFPSFVTQVLLLVKEHSSYAVLLPYQLQLLKQFLSHIVVVQ